MKSAERTKSYAHLLAVGLACGRGVRFVNRQPERDNDAITASFDAAEAKRARKAEKRLQQWNGKR